MKLQKFKFLSKLMEFCYIFETEGTSEVQNSLKVDGILLHYSEQKELQEFKINGIPLHIQNEQVASYDFNLPVTINQTGAPSPTPTSFPPTPTPSHKNSLQHIINPRRVPVPTATPRRRVVTTALRQPLQLSAESLHFVLPVHYDAVSCGVNCSKVRVPGLVRPAEFFSTLVPFQDIQTR